MLKKILNNYSERNIDSPLNSTNLIENLYKLILLTRCSFIDEKNNIHSTITFSDNALPLWQREMDLSNHIIPLSNENLNDYNYLRIFYSYLIAGIVIAKIFKFDNPAFLLSLQHIQIITTEHYQVSLEKDRKNAIRSLSEGKGHLIDLMQIYSPLLDKESLNNMLDQAKDWAALEQPTFQIMTTLQFGEKFDNKTIVILDVPCATLTDEQIEYFNEVEQKKWFQELTTFQQKLLLYYKKNIVSGKYVIPSQLRAIIPTCKNSFSQSILIKDENECTEINHYFHCGSVAHISHRDQTIALDITKSNLIQQKLNSGTDAVIMVCLNSTLADKVIGYYEKYYGRNYSPDDSTIINLTEEATAQLQDQAIYFSKICLNGFRNVEYNNYTGINRLIEIVKQNMLLIPENEIIKTLQQHIKKIGELQWQITFLDSNVKGLDIIYYLTQIATLNNQLTRLYSDQLLKTIGVWFGCASGENRTGITYFNTIGQTIIQYLEQSKNYTMTENEKREIFSIVANSQHIHIMTGNQGNTFGTEGIRYKSSGSFKHSHPQNNLITPTSDMKFLPPSDGVLNSSLDRLEEAIIKARNKTSLKTLIPLANQIIAIEKNLETKILFATNEEKNIYKDCILIIINILNNPSLHIIDELNTFLLKIKKNKPRAISPPWEIELERIIEDLKKVFPLKTSSVKNFIHSLSIFQISKNSDTNSLNEAVTNPQEIENQTSKNCEINSF